jgi:hypothetical protein
VEEKNRENTSHTAAKIRAKNSLAPSKGGNVLLGVLRHFAKENSALFVVAYNTGGWDKLGGDLRALDFMRWILPHGRRL